MELAGVLIAVLLLIFLIYKRLSLIPATLICVAVLALTNGFSYMDLFINHYGVSLAGFVGKYFLVFVTNALFGKVMEETLLASVFSKMIGKLFGDKNAVFGAMLATAILSYGGVSVFVIVFTVYPIFLATFRKADLPGKYIPACIMSSSCTFALSLLPGGAQLNNIIPVQYLGTTPAAAAGIGLLCSAAAMAFIFVYFSWEFKKARQRGEHFEINPSIKERITKFEMDAGIPGPLSVLPLVMIILLINIAQLDLSYAVLAGTGVALFIGWKNIPDKLRIINESAKLVGPAVITTAVSVGFGGAVLACNGAETVLEAISALPVPPNLSFSIAASFAGAMTGNGGGGMDVAMNLLSGQYLAAGLEPELIHRLGAVANAGFSCLPPNGMQITIMDTCGYTAGQCYKYIFISTVLCSAGCLLLANVISCLL